MANYSLALIGYGNVGRAFGRLLVRKGDVLREQFNATCKVIGIATSRHGIAIDLSGIDLEKAQTLVESGCGLDVQQASAVACLLMVSPRGTNA